MSDHHRPESADPADDEVADPDAFDPDAFDPDAIERLERTVETCLVLLVDDVQPRERTAGRVSTGALCETLDIDRRDLRELQDQPEAKSGEN